MVRGTAVDANPLRAANRCSGPAGSRKSVWYIRMTESPHAINGLRGDPDEATAAAPITTREQIIQAAADSLLENGYSGTSVRAIASRAGVAIGNLQYWFPPQSQVP